MNTAGAYWSMMKYSKPVPAKKKKRKRPKPDRISVCCFGLLIVLSCPIFQVAEAQDSPDQTDVLRAYDGVVRNIARLRLKQADRQLDSLKTTDISNHPLHPFLRQYTEFFPAFLDEDPHYYKRLSERLNSRLDRMEETASGTTWKGYCQGEALLQAAVLDLKFQRYFRGLRHLRRAADLLREHADRYSNFRGYYKSLGLLHALAGTIPDNWRWGVRWVSGIEGNLQLGMREMKYAADSDGSTYLFHNEADAVYAFALYHLDNRPEASLNRLKRMELGPGESPLVLYLLSNLYLKEGQTDRAIALLDTSRFGEDTYSLHHLDLLMGKAKLYRGDEGAERYLERFVTASPGNTFIKEAYQKLSWAAFLDDRTEDFERYRQCILWYGEEESDEDLSALREVEQDHRLHKGLLRARLYFDGGYYRRARDILDTLSPDDLETEELKLEYLYRKARVLHASGELSQAMSLYLETIARGKDQPEYYACNAALQAGYIYEKAGRKHNAGKMYHLCLDLKPEVYRRSLHQKAEAGLARLE